MDPLRGPTAQRVQSDVTHWRLGDRTEVEIVNFIDDHSRLAVAARVLGTATAPQVLRVFRAAGERWGLPAALLTDIQPESAPQVLGSLGRRHEDREDRRPSTVVDDRSERTARLLAC